MNARIFCALALAACSSGRGKDREPAAEASPHAQPAPATTDAGPIDGGSMEISYEDLPDDTWRAAAEVAMASWGPSFATRGVETTVVRPMRSPNAGVVRYLLEVKTTKADGSIDFQGAGLVWDGALLHRTGTAGVTRWLAGIGFPAERIAAGHLVQGLYLIDALPRGWLKPPAVNGWDSLTRRDEMTGELPVTLEYGKKDALLTLYRMGTATGGGHTPPPTERLEVRFAADATMTMEAARRVSDTKTWETFSL